MKKETRIKKKQELYGKMNQWLKEHDGVFPSTYIYIGRKILNKSEMTEEQKEEVAIASKWKIYFLEDKKIFQEYIELPEDSIPEIYREIIVALKKEFEHGINIEKEDLAEERKIKRYINRAIEWMTENKGKMPKLETKKGKNSTRVREENSIYRIFKNTQIVEILEEYEDIPLEEIPSKYRKFMELYREIPQKENHFDKILKWLEGHDGKMPRFAAKRDGKRLKRGEMTKEELEEARLNQKWNLSSEKKILEKYTDVALEEIPKKYRKYISRMREFGYGGQGPLRFDEIIEWLENHQETLPKKRSKLQDDKDRKYEINLRKNWDGSTEKIILKKYKGRPIEEVPKKYRERIAVLRDYGLGLTQKDIENQIFEWLEQHNGKLPQTQFTKNGVLIKRGELTKEERREVRLYNRWYSSNIRKMLNKYKGKPIEEVPEEYRERIAILRKYDLEIEEKKDIFEEIIEWLKTHEGKFPRTNITEKGNSKKTKKKENMTKEEIHEISISHRWFRSEIRKKFIEYAEIPLEQIPEEYRDKIRILREHGLHGKTLEERMKRRMKTAVANQVPNNEAIRNELGENIREDVKKEHTEFED